MASYRTFDQFSSPTATRIAQHVEQLEYKIIIQIKNEQDHLKWQKEENQQIGEEPTTDWVIAMLQNKTHLH